MTKSAKGLAKRAAHFRPVVIGPPIEPHIHVDVGHGAIALCSPTVDPEMLEALQSLAGVVSKMTSKEIDAAAVASRLKRDFIPADVIPVSMRRRSKGTNMTPPKKKRKR